MEAADEAAHIGDLDAKIKAIEDFDHKIVGPILKGLSAFNDYKVVIMPDHRTPIELRTHTHDPVPFVVLSSNDAKDEVTEYNEFSVQNGSLGIVNGHQIMNYLITGKF